MKCAEILQVKGLCGVDSISERKINSNDISDDAIIKHEISIGMLITLHLISFLLNVWIFTDEEETEIFETDCVQSIVKETGNLFHFKIYLFVYPYAFKIFM